MQGPTVLSRPCLGRLALFTGLRLAPEPAPVLGESSVFRPQSESTVCFPLPLDLGLYPLLWLLTIFPFSCGPAPPHRAGQAAQARLLPFLFVLVAADNCGDQSSALQGF